MSTLAEVPPVKNKREVLDQAVIRFAGDSGDGMQITGSQFTSTAALYGNDIATFPDYPAEIRAPAGTIPGVSGFQLHFSSNEVYTPGDAIDVLIAMNPAALKVNIVALFEAFAVDDQDPVGLEVGNFHLSRVRIHGVHHIAGVGGR